MREKVTYDGVKEQMGVMGVADADTTRGGLLRSHGARAHWTLDRPGTLEVTVRGEG